MNLAHADDRDLVPLLDGDPAAVEEFYRRHVRALTRFIARHIDDQHDVPDLVTATFIAAIESAQRYDPERGDPGSWIRGIARNLIAGRKRRRAAETRATARFGARRPAEGDEFALVDDRIDAARRAGPALAALPTLPRSERELLHLMLHDGLTVGEAADILGIRPGAARMRLARVRTRLNPAVAEAMR